MHASNCTLEAPCPHDHGDRRGLAGGSPSGLRVRTKREAIERALQELVRQQRRRAIRAHAGQVEPELNQETLQKLWESR